MKNVCPCDIDGVCPYDAQYSCDCEYWCRESSYDDPYPWEDDDEIRNPVYGEEYGLNRWGE